MNKNNCFLVIFFLLLTCSKIAFCINSSDSTYFHYTIEIDEAKKRNYLTLGDLLKQSPSIWIRSIHAPGQWETAGIAGGFEEETVLLLDGRPLFNPWSGIHNLNFISLEMIERIEIYPASNPFLICRQTGAINFVTRNLNSAKPYTQFVYRSGSDKYSDLDITFGQKISNKLEIQSGFILKKYGKSLTEYKYNTQKTRSKITYRPSPNLAFKYTILHNRFDVNMPYNHPTQDDTLKLATSKRRCTRYDHSLNSDLFLKKNHFQFQIDYTQSQYHLTENQFYPEVSVPNHYFGITLKHTFSFPGFPITWGINQQTYQVTGINDLKLSEKRILVFLNTRINILPNITLLPKGILIKSNNFDKLISALGGQVHWQLFNQTNISAGYAESIILPSLAEQFNYPVFFALPRIDFENNLRLNIYPLSSEQHEPNKNSVLHFGFQSQVLKKTYLTFRFNYRKIHRSKFFFTTSDSLETLKEYNYNTSGLHGIEFSLKQELIWGITLKSNCNLINTDQGSLPDFLEIPSLHGSNQLSWEHTFFKEDIYLTLSVEHLYWTEFSTFVINTSQREILNPGSLLNIKANLRIIKNAVLTFEWDNILDQKLPWIGGFPYSGLQNRIGLTWDLYD